jgi:hypothetical protein
VLINLIHVSALALLGKLARFQFVAVEDVVRKSRGPSRRWHWQMR